MAVNQPLPATLLTLVRIVCSMGVAHAPTRTAATPNDEEGSP